MTRTWVRVALVTALVVTSVPLASSSYADGAAFSASKTITRTHVVDGQQKVVDSRTVSLSVSDTRDLRGRQEVEVSWTGAHPTGGIVADQNSIDAQQEEYPFVLLECRGTQSTITPQTCWTQDWTERYQESFQTDFPPYRLDQYATVTDRGAVVGAPAKVPAGCFPAPTQHWVPFVASDGHVYQDGPAGCAGQPPESQSVGGSALPSNETFGVTASDGTGSTKFDIWTEAENASLGCSQKVTCSLVAVPIMGISCDPAAAKLPVADQPGADELDDVTKECESTGNFAAGQLVTPQNGEALAVSGSLWWSASNWRNRFVVPLSFGTPADACAVTGGGRPVDVYGSELLIQATNQWAPHFCLDSSLFDFKHVQTGEPQARNLIATGSANAAFTSYPQEGGYGRPVVNAPVALTGFAITYSIDDAQGRPYAQLRLTPRLLAKLLTESYPAELAVKQEYPALAGNPLNITLDPEFIALNPGITQGVGASASASALLTLSSNSDVTRALTTYINDDPAARAWLDGKPDESGMVVDPAYKGIKLPVDRWPLLSTFEPTKFYGEDLNDCLFHSPVPYLPLVAAPAATLESISESMQFSIARSTTACSQIDGTTLGEKLVALGRQTVGFRFLIGVTSLAEVERYKLTPAALATGGGAFVAPDDASLTAAAAMLKPDASTGTWPVPYDALRKSSTAYPGTMVVYAAVPTRGLAAQDAHDLASLISYVSGPGQQRGLGVGQLPPGYLPLTKADGLGELATYATLAANAIGGQCGQVPALTATSIAACPASGAGSPAPVASPSSDGGPQISSGAAQPPAPSPVIAPPDPLTLAQAPSPYLGSAGLLVEIAAGLTAAGAVGAPAAWTLTRRRRGRARV